MEAVAVAVEAEAAVEVEAVAEVVAASAREEARQLSPVLVAGRPQAWAQSLALRVLRALHLHAYLHP